LTLATSPLAAATPSEFYTSLLRRGVVAFDGGRYEEAARLLRIAAFGSVDAVPQYQTAEAYMALAYDRLGQSDRAREAARRVVVAERVAGGFTVLPLPPGVRTAFDTLAARLLTPTEVASLQKAQSKPAPGNSVRQTQTAATAPPRPATQQVPPATQPAKTATTSQAPPPSTVPAQQSAVKQPVTASPAPVRVPSPEPAKPSTATSTSRQPASSVAGGTDGHQATATKPAPAPSSAATPPRVTAPRVPTQQAPVTPPVQVAARPPAARPPAPAVDLEARLETAENALNSANLAEARAIYRELAGMSAIARDALVRTAEGAYRARDFQTALKAFGRIGVLRAAEEPYHYYIAVALYETGQYARAKKELASALPFIRITPDVARYRAKIEGSIN